MPDSPKVTLVVWRDAKTDPPDHRFSKWYPTDVGERYYENERVEWDLPNGIRKPSVWCDPIPPGGDALTVEDLRVLATPANRDAAQWLAAVTRLRRALEAIERS